MCWYDQDLTTFTSNKVPCCPVHSKLEDQVNQTKLSICKMTETAISETARSNLVVRNRCAPQSNRSNAVRQIVSLN